jgi:hypothetical protein
VREAIIGALTAAAIAAAISAAVYFLIPILACWSGCIGARPLPF